MTAPNTLDLLPCPFCGKSEGVMSEEYRQTHGCNEGEMEWLAGCTNCGAVFERMETKEDAITAWNTRAQLQADADELARLREAVNTPELHDFAKGVVMEAAHQRERWGSNHDAGKDAPDWFWLVGYLAGKALRAHVEGDMDKALHHTISTAAALANWHAAISGASTAMRPGIGPDKLPPDPTP